LIKEAEQIKDSYAAAGVNIDAADKVKELIKQHVQATLRPEVLAGPGLFGGLFEFKGFKQPVLVSSVDGVGTKLKIASALDKHDTIGIDLVNHCVNDILTCGAEPLFFLDYIAMGKLVTERLEAIVQGLAKACQEVNCALIGGETAEMPGVYAEDDYDLVGFIIGAVEKDNIIDGKTMAVGDTVIGLASSGLHTNGYSLVRKVFGDTASALSKYYPELGKTLGQELLEPHRGYYHRLKPVLPLIKGMAHITGGGLIGNVPRILPEGLAVKFNSKSWAIPPIFQLIQKQGGIDKEEMYRVFNMGIGMVLICSPDKVEQLVKQLPESKVIGEVGRQLEQARVVIK
jgi:phosphoribosylformylglycinamidine cyclo-ligase